MKVFAVALVAVVAMLYFASPAKADTDIMQEIRSLNVFKLKTSSLACPMIVVGNACPEENPLYYFKCCGEVNTNCCFRLQDWAIVLIGIMILLIIVSIIVNLIRCICCY
ncbi:hypothetical protein M3Y97_00448900 [Aphelenchoides bicaudatus]|nr:hypothetical protein M3Y97_00448900 [Aphelenchoides bicaudatus]